MRRNASTLCADGARHAEPRRQARSCASTKRVWSAATRRAASGAARRPPRRRTARWVSRAHATARTRSSGGSPHGVVQRAGDPRPAGSRRRPSQLGARRGARSLDQDDRSPRRRATASLRGGGDARVVGRRRDADRRKSRATSMVWRARNSAASSRARTVCAEGADGVDDAGLGWLRRPTFFISQHTSLHPSKSATVTTSRPARYAALPLSARGARRRAPRVRLAATAPPHRRVEARARAGAPRARPSAPRRAARHVVRAAANPAPAPEVEVVALGEERALRRGLFARRSHVDKGSTTSSMTSRARASAWSRGRRRERRLRTRRARRGPGSAEVAALARRATALPVASARSRVWSQPCRRSPLRHARTHARARDRSRPDGARLTGRRTHVQRASRPRRCASCSRAPGWRASRLRCTRPTARRASASVRAVTCTAHACGCGTMVTHAGRPSPRTRKFGTSWLMQHAASTPSQPRRREGATRNSEGDARDVATRRGGGVRVTRVLVEALREQPHGVRALVLVHVELHVDELDDKVVDAGVPLHLHREPVVEGGGEASPVGVVGHEVLPRLLRDVDHEDAARPAARLLLDQERHAVSLVDVHSVRSVAARLFLLERDKYGRRMLTHLLRTLWSNASDGPSVDDFHDTELTLLKGTEASIETTCLRALVEGTTRVRAVRLDDEHVVTLPSLAGHHASQGPVVAHAPVLSGGTLRACRTTSGERAAAREERRSSSGVRRARPTRRPWRSWLDEMEATFGEDDEGMLGHSDHARTSYTALCWSGMSTRAAAQADGPAARRARRRRGRRGRRRRGGGEEEGSDDARTSRPRPTAAAVRGGATGAPAPRRATTRRARRTRARGCQARAATRSSVRPSGAARAKSALTSMHAAAGRGARRADGCAASAHPMAATAQSRSYVEQRLHGRARGAWRRGRRGRRRSRRTRARGGTRACGWCGAAAPQAKAAATSAASYAYAARQSAQCGEDHLGCRASRGHAAPVPCASW